MEAGEESGGELVGKVLGERYRVTSMIGRGGMGVVARAVDELLNREVAVKVLRAFTDSGGPELADLRARMRREAQAAARIRHNGVVTVHDVTEERGLPVIVMELVDGPSLDTVLSERGTLEPHEAAAIGARLMDALDAAHRVGVLHRDVKPGNVLLENGGRVVLTDFGIASMEAAGDDAMAKLTRSGDLVGSLDFLPPERAQGRDPGPASDIWSLGMTLYAAVEGTSPFRRTSVWSTLTAIVTEPLPEPRRAGPLTPVLLSLMAKDPDARPDAARARELLDQVAAGGTADVVPPPSAMSPPPSPQPAPAAAGFGPPPAQTPPSPYGQHASGPGPQQGPYAADPRAASGRARRRSRAVIAAAAAAVVLAGGGVTYALTSQGGGADKDGEANAAPTRSGSPAEGAQKGERDAEHARKKARSASPSPRERERPPRSPSARPTHDGDGKDQGKGERRKPGSKTRPGDGDGDDGKPPITPTPQPTSASESCDGWKHRNPSPGTYGTMSGSFNIVSGPYQKCADIKLAKSGQKLWYHCSVVNAHGHNWTYVRLAGTNTVGWMSNDNLTRQNGPSTRC
ncbi:serine/threonine-protein kinase [Streptomyces sp. NPDC048172]|uniref:serine/threonine-protein kinase n=1 Tax=Streptomyces sp. NPDC048172 TaxID=3365505 RepID=UPI0037202E10